MKVGLLMMLGLLFGCDGQDTQTFISQPEKVILEEREVVKEKEVLVNQTFENIWLCDNASVVEIYTDSENRFYIDSYNQQIRTLNPSSPQPKTTTNHPSFDVERLDLNKKNQIVYTYDVTYSNGHNLRKDLDNSTITGKKGTQYTFTETTEGMSLNIKVFDRVSSDKNRKVIVNRTIQCT